MSFPRYPAYKDSGVEWLGEVPEPWHLSKIKWLYRFVKRQDNADAPVLSVYRDYGVINKSSRDDNINKTPDDLSLYQTVQVGDLVINKMKAWQGSLGVSGLLGITSPDYAVFEMRHEGNDRFLHHLLRSRAMPSVYQTISNGIRPDQWRLEPDKFGHLLIPLPPSHEQAAIAAFLDRETAKIDALVAEQEKLIALLAEKRQAVISHAVTKGLDPAAPIKDSGIEWLGEVPEHWEVVPVKRLTPTSGPRGWAELTGNEGAAFFQSQHIGYAMDVALDDPKRLIPPTDADAERARLQADDVVICITGGRTGAVAHVPENIEEAYINQHVCLLRPERDISGRFVAYSLFSSGSQEQLACASYGLKQGLGLDQVRSIFLASPPSKEEQLAIASFLDRQTANLDALTAEARRAINLLKEHRSALISAAVTGKIDVRQCLADNIVPFTPRQRRNLLAAEVIRRCHNDNTFGRTKAHKMFYLLNAHLGIGEFDGQYLRWIAGPYDAGMMNSAVSDLEGAGWFREVKDGERYLYRPLAKAAEVRTAFADAWNERKDEIGRFIDLLRPLDTQASEVVATLYAAWNDFLLHGQAVDDAKLLTEVTTNWHESKKSIPQRAWKDGLRWMRQHGVVPKGTGSQTIQQMSLGL